MSTLQDHQHKIKCSRPGATLPAFSIVSPGRKQRVDFAPRLRFPSRRENRAVELGADELIARAGWIFRSRPRGLRNLRRTYRDFCLFLLEKIERAE